MGDVHEQEGNSKLWLVTFTDVMALMLTFFVLLFSMSHPRTEVWSEMTAALQTEFNKFYGSTQLLGPVDGVNLDKIKYNQALDLRYLEALMQDTLSGNDILGTVSMETRDGRIMISLPQDLLFDAGQATVKPEGSKALYALAGVLSRIKNKIEVVGHTDPRPISGGEYGSNWELSLARAANVAVILKNVGYEKEITVRGMASGRYDDLQGVVDEDERLKISRRVDIVLMDHDGSRGKVFFDRE
ncbi:MAG: OmpA family protein [Rhodospirillales bacterium]|nr:OmpA family protein [Rhodospirillales bacterium]